MDIKAREQERFLMKKQIPNSISGCLRLLALVGCLTLIVACANENAYFLSDRINENDANNGASAKDVLLAPEPLHTECQQNILFELKEERNPSHNMKVFVNGQIQEEGVDYFYSTSQNGIFFSDHSLPQKNDRVEIHYHYHIQYHSH